MASMACAREHTREVLCLCKAFGELVSRKEGGQGRRMADPMGVGQRAL